jgi:hypothetical protein
MLLRTFRKRFHKLLLASLIHSSNTRNLLNAKILDSEYVPNPRRRFVSSKISRSFLVKERIFPYNLPSARREGTDPLRLTTIFVEGQTPYEACASKLFTKACLLCLISAFLITC